MPCDKFRINEYGKVIVTREDGKKAEKELDVLRFPDGKKYIVDKDYLRRLEEFTPETLQNAPIYLWIGANHDENYGVTGDIHDAGGRDTLESFIERIKSVKDIKKFLN